MQGVHNCVDCNEEACCTQHPSLRDPSRSHTPFRHCVPYFHLNGSIFQVTMDKVKHLSSDPHFFEVCYNCVSTGCFKGFSTIKEHCCGCSSLFEPIENIGCEWCYGVYCVSPWSKTKLLGREFVFFPGTGSVFCWPFFQKIYIYCLLETCDGSILGLFVLSLVSVLGG